MGASRMDRAAVRAVALRVAALALLLLLALVAVLTTRTLQRLPDATIYLVRYDDRSGFELEPVARRLGTDDAEAYARAAVAALADGPTEAEAAQGLSTAVPEGTRVVGASARDGTLRVELSTEVASGGGTASMRGRLEQLRWTLTRPSSIETVDLWIDGEPLRVLGGEGLMVDPSWRRPDDDRTPSW